MTMKKPNSHRIASSRTSLRLTGTVRSVEAKADHAMDLGLAYAVEWLLQAGSLKPSSSAVLRRALAVYLVHLASADPSMELRAVRRASESHLPDLDARETAWKALRGTDKAEPLPPFTDMLLGHEALQRIQGLNAKVDELCGKAVGSRLRIPRVIH